MFSGLHSPCLDSSTVASTCCHYPVNLLDAMVAGGGSSIYRAVVDGLLQKLMHDVSLVVRALILLTRQLLRDCSEVLRDKNTSKITRYLGASSFPFVPLCPCLSKNRARTSKPTTNGLASRRAEHPVVRLAQKPFKLFSRLSTRPTPEAFKSFCRL